MESCDTRSHAMRCWPYQPPILRPSRSAAQQRKSCKVSKIKKPRDGTNNTIHSPYLAVISDCSSQVLTFRRSLVYPSIYKYLCNVTWQGIQVRANEHLPSLVSAQASNMKNLLIISRHELCAVRVLSTWLLGAYKSMMAYGVGIAHNSFKQTSYSPSATKEFG